VANLVRILVLLVASVPAVARAQLPTFRVWPDTSPPCNGTLQECIDASVADDAIEVITNGPIDESILLTKSLELQAAAGFHPTFAAGRSIIAQAPGNDRFFLIKGFTLPLGGIYVANQVAGALTAWVIDNTCISIGVVANTGRWRRISSRTASLATSTRRGSRSRVPGRRPSPHASSAIW
jgi:hypothetical protein